MMKDVGPRHVVVVCLLQVDGDGAVTMLDKTVAKELDVLMKTKLGDMLYLKDAADVDEGLA